MRKPKFVLKVNQNNTAKVYVGGKWHKYVQEVDVIAKPQNIQVILTELKTNKKGFPYTVDAELAIQVKCYFFGNKYLRELEDGK